MRYINYIVIYLSLISISIIFNKKFIYLQKVPSIGLIKKDSFKISGKYECEEIIEINPQGSKICWKTDIKEPYAQGSSWIIHHPTLIEVIDNKITYKTSTEIYITGRHPNNFELFLECEGTIRDNEAILTGKTIAKTYIPKNIDPSEANLQEMTIKIESDSSLLVIDKVTTVNPKNGKVVGVQNGKFRLKKIQ